MTVISNTPSLYEIRTVIAEPTVTDVYGLFESDKIIAEYIDPSKNISISTDSKYEAYKALKTKPYNIFDFRNYNTANGYTVVGDEPQYDDITSTIFSHSGAYTRIHRVDTDNDGQMIFEYQFNHYDYFSTNHSVTPSTNEAVEYSTFSINNYSSTRVRIRYFITKKNTTDNYVYFKMGEIIFDVSTNTVYSSRVTTSWDDVESFEGDTVKDFEYARIGTNTHNGNIFSVVVIVFKAGLFSTIRERMIVFNDLGRADVRTFTIGGSVLEGRLFVGEYSSTYAKNIFAFRDDDGNVYTGDITTYLGIVTFSNLDEYDFGSAFTVDLAIYNYDANYYYFRMASATQSKAGKISRNNGAISYISTSTIYDSTNRNIIRLVSDYRMTNKLLYLIDNLSNASADSCALVENPYASFLFYSNKALAPYLEFAGHNCVINGTMLAMFSLSSATFDACNGKPIATKVDWYGLLEDFTSD